LLVIHNQILDHRATLANQVYELPECN
jgi:hypothetical protein